MKGVGDIADLGFVVVLAGEEGERCIDNLVSDVGIGFLEGVRLGCIGFFGEFFFDLGKGESLLFSHDAYGFQPLEVTLIVCGLGGAASYRRGEDSIS